MEHFANKRAFRYFDNKCLRDYVYFGTDYINSNDKSSGIKLKFDPMIEWSIYRTMPSIQVPKLPKDIFCGLIYGQYSKVISEQDSNYMSKNYDITCHKLADCGHLFPFEKPEETAAAIEKLL